MNKQDVYKLVQEKITITTEELDKIYNDLAKEFEERKVKPTEELVLNRLYAFLTPSLRTNATKHKGVFLGIMDNFFFNKSVDTVKFDSLQRYKDNPQEAISEGVVDANGNPIWHTVEGVNVPDFKLQRQILPSDYSATVYIMQEDSVDGKIIGFTLKTMSIRGERRERKDENGKIVWSILNDISKLKNREVEFMGIDKENNVINDSKFTKFTVLDDREVDVSKLLVKHAKNNCLSLNTIKDFYKDNADKLRSMPVFVRGTVSDIIVSETRDNNIVVFTDIGYDKQFSIFVPKNLDVPSVGTPNVIFGGLLRYSDKKPEQPFTLNAFMYYVPENLRNMKIPESLSKFKHVEEEVKDTSASQKLLQAQKTVDEDW